MPFYIHTTTIKRPFKKDFPKTTQTIKDQLKRKRYDLRLLQHEVACIFGVSEDTIRNWETGKTFPQLKFYPKIISFLGFNPFMQEVHTSEDPEFKDTIFRFRRLFGMTCMELGKILGVDPTTVLSWEKGKTTPSQKVKEEVHKRLEVLRSL